MRTTILLTAACTLALGCAPTTPEEAAPGASQRLGSADLHSCALDAQGVAHCWGFAEQGATNAPTDRRFEAIDAARSQTCAIEVGGAAVVCWGYAPVEVAGDPRQPFVSIHVGSAGACALDIYGEATCWGHEPDEALDRVAPGAFETISVGEHAACGIRASGRIDCWGAEADDLEIPDAEVHDLQLHGGLVCGLTVDGQAVGSDAACVAVPDGVWSAWSVLYDNGCVLDDEGQPTCTGEFIGGKEPTTDLVEVDVGGLHACGIDQQGDLSCWGLEPTDPCDFGQVTDAPVLESEAR